MKVGKLMGFRFGASHSAFELLLESAGAKFKLDAEIVMTIYFKQQAFTCVLEGEIMHVRIETARTYRLRCCVF